MYDFNVVIDLSEIKSKLRELEDYTRSNKIYRKEHKSEVTRNLIEPLGVYFKKHIKLIDTMVEKINTKNLRYIIFKPNHISDKRKHITRTYALLPYLNVKYNNRKDLLDMYKLMGSKYTIPEWSVMLEIIEHGINVNNIDLVTLKRRLVKYYNYYKDLVNYILHNKPYELMILL